MNLRICIIYLITFLCLTSCTNKQLGQDSIENKKYNKKAIELNAEAIEILGQIIFPNNHADTLKLRNAIDILEKSITIDSLYYLAYANKAIALSRLGQNSQALNTLNKITNLKPDYAEGFSMQGFMFEKMGNIDSANSKYKEAIGAYNYRLNKANKIEDKINRAFILSLINREKGLNEINDLIRDNPDNTTIEMWKKQLFDQFNRKEFIDSQ